MDEQEPIEQPMEQPAYPSTGEYVPPKKKRYIRHIALFSALFLLLGGALYVVRVYDFRIDNMDGGLSFTIDKKDDETPSVVVLPEEITETITPEANAIQREAQVDGPQLSLTDADDCDALSLSSIYDKAIVSVVSIVSTTTAGTITGNGIIMSEDGYIITTHTVIDQAYSIEVLLHDNTLLAGALVGSDEASDLAVLKVEASNLTPAEFGDSDEASVGDSVVAIGDPLGIKLRGTMTNGIISAINHNLDVKGRIMNLMQTNAYLSATSTGGPLLNDYGQVIAINTSNAGNLYATSSVEGLGFAIPIATVKPIVDELISTGFVAGQPSLGLDLQALSVGARAYYRLPNGLYISSVVTYSDAYEKGIRSGDVLLAVDDVELTSVESWNIMKSNYTPGQTVTVNIYRSGTIYAVDIVLIDQNAPAENLGLGNDL